MIDLAVPASILLTGTAYAMVLYVTAVGLSVTMGLLGIANLAHGAFAMGGGYLLILFAGRYALPYPVALLLACALIGALSVFLERVLYARFYGAPELDQVVMSIGLIFVSVAIARWFFGVLPLSAQAPGPLVGQVTLGPVGVFPAYRLFLIGVGFAVFILLWVGIERTVLGARIRATVDNRGMAQAIGINTQRLFTVIFAIGSTLAALGGALGAEMIPIAPDYPLVHLVYFLIVVAVGGLGSVLGPFFAALLLGIGDTACRILAPNFGAFFVYMALFLILLVKPAGLFGRT
jgi:branched-chain amino acid transport system permease protein